MRHQLPHGLCQGRRILPRNDPPGHSFHYHFSEPLPRPSSQGFFRRTALRGRQAETFPPGGGRNECGGMNLFDEFLHSEHSQETDPFLKVERPTRSSRDARSSPSPATRNSQSGNYPPARKKNEKGRQSLLRSSAYQSIDGLPLLHFVPRHEQVGIHTVVNDLDSPFRSEILETIACLKDSETPVEIRRPSR